MNSWPCCCKGGDDPPPPDKACGSPSPGCCVSNKSILLVKWDLSDPGMEPNCWCSVMASGHLRLAAVGTNSWATESLPNSDIWNHPSACLVAQDASSRTVALTKVIVWLSNDKRWALRVGHTTVRRDFATNTHTRTEDLWDYEMLVEDQTCCGTTGGTTQAQVTYLSDSCSGNNSPTATISLELENNFCSMTCSHCDHSEEEMGCTENGRTDWSDPVTPWDFPYGVPGPTGTTPCSYYKGDRVISMEFLNHYCFQASNNPVRFTWVYRRFSFSDIDMPFDGSETCQFKGTATLHWQDLSRGHDTSCQNDPDPSSPYHRDEIYPDEPFELNKSSGWNYGAWGVFAPVLWPGLPLVQYQCDGDFLVHDDPDKYAGYGSCNCSGGDWNIRTDWNNPGWPENSAIGHIEIGGGP